MTSGNEFMIMLSMLVIMVIQNVFTLIPLILVISVNISLFGFWNGYLWSWATSVVGGVIVFLAARYWFSEFLMNKLHPRWLDHVERKGPWFVFLGRVIPFIPTSIVNIAAGASVVSLKHFAVGTIIGNLLFFFFMSLVSYGVTSALEQQTIYGAVVVAVIVAVYTGYRFIRKRRQPPEEADGTEGLSEQIPSPPPAL